MIYHLKKILLSSLAMFPIQLTANSLQLSMKKSGAPSRTPLFSSLFNVLLWHRSQPGLETAGF